MLNTFPLYLRRAKSAEEIILRRLLNGGKLYQRFRNKETILHRHMKSRSINYLMFTVQALVLFKTVPQFHKDAI